MALAQKGSRKLVVDGIAYRWAVRRQPTYCQEMGWSNLSFAVEAANDGYCVLHVQTDATRPDSVAVLGGNTEVMAVTPAMVADSIQLALQQGWQPHKPGSAFALNLPAGDANRASDMPLPGN